MLPMTPSTIRKWPDHCFEVLWWSYLANVVSMLLAELFHGSSAATDGPPLMLPMKAVA